MVARSVGKLKKERPLDRHPCTRCLVCKSIEIRHQAISLFDKPPADRFGGWTTNPRLLVAGSLLRVVPIDGLERGNLDPLCEQVLLRGSGISAHIGATQGKAAEAQVFKHRGCKAKVVPS